MNLEIPSIRLRHRSWPVITFIGTQWSPAETKARKWTRMLSFGTVWKLNPGFWSSWLTWRREQHNEGRESGGKGAQKYGRRENVHGKRETLTPLSPPPPTIFTTIYKAPESFGHLNFPRIPVAPVKFVDRLLLLNVYQQSLLQTEGYCRPLEPQCDGTLILWLKHLSSIWL